MQHVQSSTEKCLLAKLKDSFAPTHAPTHARQDKSVHAIKWEGGIYPMCLFYYLFVAEKGGIKCDRRVGADRYKLMCVAKKMSKKKKKNYAKTLYAGTYTHTMKSKRG